MEADSAGSAIHQAYITMGAMVKAAKMNGIIAKHPMDGVQYAKPVRAAEDIRFLTRKEQSAFLEAAKHPYNYSQYALILETGLRTGEMIGLTWDAIGFERHTLTVNKTLEFRHAEEQWRAGPRKRGIPTPQEQLKAGCSPRYCKSCSAMPASKRLWTGMFM